MRRVDDMPIDPETAAYLEAIDATLAGEPVDPRQAEVAELALLLADERPRPRPEFVSSLDARAARRFAPAAPSGVPGRPAVRHRWRIATGWSLAATCAAALVVAVLAISSGPSSTSSSVSSSASTPSPATAAPSASSSASGAAAASTASTPQRAAAPQDLSAASAGSSGRALSLPPNGRKTIQSADLELSTAPKSIDAVAQEVFNVVGQANGIVDSSQVTQTGGSDGTASFALRLPSSTLGQTLGRLSDLRGAQVLSRTDNSQDVNGQYVSANRQLADDTALRDSLLKQLANAVTTQQVDSIKARLHNAETSIAGDQAALRQLNAQIDYSVVKVTIDASATPAPAAHHSSGGFTLGHAAHVAGRVLVVAAGVGLIALAALAPAVLVGALLAWGAALLRRRRREQALDLA